MQTARRPLRRAFLLLPLVLSLLLPAVAAERSRVQVKDYVIDADIVPKTHRLTAKVKVTFLATDDANFASFELHNALHITKVLDANGKSLTAERVSQDNAVRVAFPTAIPKGSTSTLTFEYEGALAHADDSPVEGLKLAYIGEDMTHLLYAGRWFPITNYGIDRFTAAINITAPQGTLVVGSGSTAAPKPGAGGKTVTSFTWQKPSFPG